MPKRDEAYMEQQRAAIARAALEVLLEKGVYGASRRDICKAAGISTGAFYIHFKTKEEVIAAACALDFEAIGEEPPASTWDDYIGLFSLTPRSGSDGRKEKRLRLSLQFAAELSRMQDIPPEAALIYQAYRTRIAQSLEQLASLDAIELPLGIDATTDSHMQLHLGAQYQLLINPSLAPEAVLGVFHSGLALTAGRLEAPARPMAFPVPKSMTSAVPA